MIQHMYITSNGELILSDGDNYLRLMSEEIDRLEELLKEPRYRRCTPQDSPYCQECGQNWYTCLCSHDD